MRQRLWQAYDRLIRRRDEVNGQNVLYKTYTSTLPGRPAIGQPAVRQYEDHELFMPVEALDVEEVATSGGTYHLGDQRIDVRHAEPSYDDRVVIAGKWHRPIDIKPIEVAGPHGWTIVLRECPPDV